jgi:membrane-bound inhibitor of C-type lysozyme
VRGGAEPTVIIRLSGILAVLGLFAGVTAGAFAQSMSSSMSTSAPKKVVVHYLCSGLKVTAYYDNVKKHVSFIYGDHHYQLPQVTAADGARYVGKGLEWWEKGPNVTLSSVDPGQTTGDTVLANCSAAK